MPHHIARLQCQCTVAVGGGAAGAAASRATAVVHDRLPMALGEAMDAAFGDDPTVYVLRSVTCRATARLDHHPEETIARQLSAAIVDVIRAHPYDDHEVVRFTSTASHMASFLRDTVAGTARGKWYYRRFRELDGLAVADVLRALVRERSADLPELVGLLQREGLLPAVLRGVDDRTIRSLWRHDDIGAAGADLDAIVATADDLVSALRWWLPGVAGAPSWRDQYLSITPPSPDWRDPASLADAVVAVIRWLQLIGCVVVPRQGDVDPLAIPARFDWLDRARLVEGLRALTTDGTRRMAPLTPRQAALRADVEAAIGECAASLDPSAPAANALLVWAALVARRPRWRDDTAARALVSELTGAACGPATAMAPEEIAARGGSGIPTGAAGIFLLVRAVQDLQLASGAAGAGLPVAPVLDALARRWAGPAVAVDDPSLAALAGDLGEPLLAATFDDEALAEWQVVTLTTLIGQRLVQPDRLRIRRIPHGHEAIAVVAGDPSDRLWAAGVLDQYGPSSSTLVDRWTRAADQRPEVETMAPGAADAGRDRLLDALATLTHAHAGAPLCDLTLDLIAMVAVRAWARWLRGFSSSTIPFLFEAFIRRPGWLVIDADELVVQLEARPHDIALEVAGYLEPFEPPGVTGWRRVAFEIVS